METVTDYFGRERQELEVTWDLVRAASEAAALLAAGGARVDLVVDVVRQRYGVESSSRAGALREMVALIGHAVRALESVDPENGIGGVSLFVPLEGGWRFPGHLLVCDRCSALIQGSDPGAWENLEILEGVEFDNLDVIVCAGCVTDSERERLALVTCAGFASEREYLEAVES